MGWAGGSSIFEPVADAVVSSSGMDGETRRRILVALIQALRYSDWDTVDDVIGGYTDNPDVMAAFAECGLTFDGEDEDDDPR